LVVYCDIDYYKTLGVARDADERDIKRQYRKLSKQWHPDKNRGDDSAHEKFVQISEGKFSLPVAHSTYVLNYSL